MTNTKQRILFFTPYATRTGSEMMLLYILQHIDRSCFEVGVVSFADGELLKEIPADIQIFIIPRKFSFLQKIKYHLGANPVLTGIRNVSKAFKADIWYLNTIMMPETLQIAREQGVKLITHFHELPLTYAYLSGADFKNIVDYSDVLIGCSGVTCTAIKNAGGKKVELLYSFINSEKIETSSAASAEIRKNLGIPKDSFVWILSGVTSERKGFDFLPDITEALNDPNVHLVWVGDQLDDGLVYYTLESCRNMTSGTKIHFPGKQTEQYYNYLNMGDGFLLTSRQDPFPLVMIEAAYLGKPIVSFPSGGVAEFVEEGMGVVTEDLSVKQMVAAMRDVMSGRVVTDPAKSHKRAARFNVENGYQDWLRIIDTVSK